MFDFAMWCESGVGIYFSPCVDYYPVYLPMDRRLTSPSSAPLMFTHIFAPRHLPQPLFRGRGFDVVTHRPPRPLRKRGAAVLVRGNGDGRSWLSPSDDVTPPHRMRVGASARLHGECSVASREMLAPLFRSGHADRVRRRQSRARGRGVGGDGGWDDVPNHRSQDVINGEPFPGEDSLRLCNPQFRAFRLRRPRTCAARFLDLQLPPYMGNIVDLRPGGARWRRGG